ncbi:hypothetical protein [Bradyrhizobium sp. NP1]|uniref:hypothetical protein n=1 Tax=Bradyrhizobium sp. NP1 TaxID=3049772 RepID=UPI0025A5BB93|nr:hypothetical protein [Bradyrhizobium sp. NP1]WJR80180.1 hypothetical protein QOU61_10600 [Bradyrhizobium sp. NP1]
MHFEALSPQAIKSITQRSLLLEWNELARGRRFPALSGFHPDAGLHDPAQLIIWNVEHDGGTRRFRACYQGRYLAEAFNASWVGRTLDTVVPDCLRPFVLETANECVDSRCAVFSILSTLDIAGHRVDCERLLLPFGRDGEIVEQVVASVQLISLKGSFDRKTVLQRYQQGLEITVAGRISAGFARPPIATSAGAGALVELGPAAKFR